MQPTTRRVWSPRGKRPIAQQNPKFEWLYAYTFVHPQSGDNFWLIMPTVNTELMNLSLKEFSKYADPNQEKIMLLLIDKAGWHVSHELEIPENIRLFPLPAYTPQLQPVECIWPLVREVTANRAFVSLADLENTVVDRSSWLNSHPDVVKGAVGFEWICNIESGMV